MNDSIKNSLTDQIKQACGRKVLKWLKGGSDPTDAELAVFDRAMKYMAVSSKFGEEQYGSELGSLNEDGKKGGNGDDLLGEET